MERNKDALTVVNVSNYRNDIGYCIRKKDNF